MYLPAMQLITLKIVVLVQYAKIISSAVPEAKVDYY